MYLKRLYQYQKERFPLLAHGLLIAAFCFSAIGYSRQLRHVDGFIPGWQYAICFLTNLSVFFLLRVADEHKDAEDDAKYRSHLPVPRGLVTLRELRITGLLFLLLTLTLNLVFVVPMLPLLLLTLGYLLLMRYEFFIPDWLRRHMGWYMVSHMFIIPLADLYASGYDWRLHGASPGLGLLLFFGVSYANGVVLEIGRKLRAPESESPGVETYTQLWGFKRACLLWLGVLLLNYLLALAALLYAGISNTLPFLSIFFVLAVLAWIPFYRRPTPGREKWVEKIAFVWALAMYLIIGGIPMLLNLLQS